MKIKTALAAFVTVMSIGGIQVSGNTETRSHLTYEQVKKTYGWRNQYHDRAYYDVQQGDTLSDISFEYGVSVSELARVNRIEDINYIQVGQRLTFKGVNYEKSME